MTREGRRTGDRTFDLDRVRRNWDKAKKPSRAEAVPPRLTIVEPEDPYPIAEELLGDARRLAASELGDRAHKLDPFLNQAETLLGELRAAPPGDAARDLGKQLTTLLKDIGDLADVLATMRR